VANRERVRPYVMNVPDERRAEVDAELEKWFQATQYVLQAQYLASDNRTLTPVLHMQEARTADALYEKAMELNPEDRNTPFLRARARAKFELYLAHVYFNAGEAAQAIEHLRRSAAAAPNSIWGARAKFILESPEERLNYLKD